MRYIILFGLASMVYSHCLLASEKIFAKGEQTFEIDKPKYFCKQVYVHQMVFQKLMEVKDEIVVLIFPQTPEKTALKNSAPFTVDRRHFLLDGHEVATDVSGDNCRDSSPDSLGSDMNTVFHSSEQYKVTEAIFALYSQKENDCEISYKLYRTIDAKFWDLPVKLKQKSGHSKVHKLETLKNLKCESITIDDEKVKSVLSQQLRPDFINNTMKPETQEIY